MAFNDFDSTMGNCPCRQDCKDRNAYCHSYCTKYKEWQIEQKHFSNKVKLQRKKAGFGTPWNYTRYR